MSRHRRQRVQLPVNHSTPAPRPGGFSFSTPLRDDLSIGAMDAGLTIDQVRKLYSPPRTLGTPESVRAALDSRLESDGFYSLLQHSIEMGQYASMSNFLGYGTLQGIAQNGLVRACVETVSDDMTRNWIELKREGEIEGEKEEEKPKKKPMVALPHGVKRPEEKPAEDEDLDDDKLFAQIMKELKRLDVQKILHEASSMVGYYGGCLIFLDTGVSGDDLRNPLNLDPKHSAEANHKGFLKAIRLIDPINVFPGVYNSTNPLARDYYKPKTWWILGQEVHSSRLLRLVANEAPLIFKPNYNFLGIPQSQILWDYILHFQSNRDALNRMMGKFSLTVFKTSMSDILNGNASNLAMMDARMQILARNKSNDGVFAIDKDAEDVVNITTQMSGMTDVVRQSLEILAALNRTPAVKLLGISPSGFNATGESDLRNYYDHVLSQQEKVLRVPIQTILDIVQISLFGKLDSKISFDFNPLSEEDESSSAMNQSTKVNTLMALLDRNVLSPEEVRTVLANDPKSGLDNIDPEAVPEDPEQAMGGDPMGGMGGGMPPGMPGMPDGGQEPLGQEPAQPQMPQMPGALGAQPGEDEVAEDAPKWITVHPGGKGNNNAKGKGTPVLIDDEDGRILGGMGGKHTGERIGEMRKKFTGPHTPKDYKRPADEPEKPKTPETPAPSSTKSYEKHRKTPEERLARYSGKDKRVSDNGDGFVVTVAGEEMHIPDYEKMGIDELSQEIEAGRRSLTAMFELGKTGDRAQKKRAKELYQHESEKLSEMREQLSIKADAERNPFVGSATSDEARAIRSALDATPFEFGKTAEEYEEMVKSWSPRFKTAISSLPAECAEGTAKAVHDILKSYPHLGEYLKGVASVSSLKDHVAKRYEEIMVSDEFEEKYGKGIRDYVERQKSFYQHLVQGDGYDLEKHKVVARAFSIKSLSDSKEAFELMKDATPEQRLEIIGKYSVKSRLAEQARTVAEGEVGIAPKMGRGVMACCSGTYGSPNSKVWLGKYLDDYGKLEGVYSMSVSGKFHPAGYISAPESVVSHELGHAVVIMLGADKDPRLSDLFDHRKHSTKTLGDDISIYGKTNIHEMIAECMAEVRTSVHPRQFAKDVINRINELYEEKFGGV